MAAGPERVLLYRLTAPHFVCGVLVRDGGVVVRAAPIVKYMAGWNEQRVRAYCARKGWSLAPISSRL